MRYPFRKSVRTSLLLLALISIIPTLGIAVYAAINARNHELADITRNAQRTIWSLAREHERDMEDCRRFLLAVSGLPEVVNHDGPRCDRLFYRFLKENPIYEDIFAADEGGVEFGSALPHPRHSVAGMKQFNDAKTAMDFSVGGYAGNAGRRATLLVAHPITDGTGKFRGVVAVALDLTRYAKILKGEIAPEAETFALIDREGTFLSTFPRPELYTGKRDPEDRFTRMTGANDEGIFEGTGFDGLKRLYAFTRFSLPGEDKPYLYMRVGIPEAQVFSRVRRILTANLTLVACAFVAAMALAWLMVNFVGVRRLNALVAASHRLGRGDLSARTGLVHRDDELGRLTIAFDAMAGELERKELDRREAEEALQSQYRFLQDMVDAIPHPVFYKDRGAVYRWCNKAFEEYVGRPRDAIIGKTVFEVQPKEVADMYYLMDRQLFSNPGTQAYETVVQHSSGARREVIITKAAYKEADGTVAGLIGVMVDVSDQRQAEEALRRSEEKYRNIFNDSILGIFQTTPDGRFVTVNQAFADIHGYESPEEIISMTADIADEFYVNPEDRIKFKETLEAHDVARQFETHMYRRDRTAIWVRMNARAIRDSEGRVLFYEGTLEDITNRRKVEDALRESEERYRVAIENSNDGVAIMRGESHVYVNQRFVEMFGYDSPPDILGKPNSLIVHPDDRTMVKDILLKRQRGESVPKRYEFRGIKKDGTPICVDVSATDTVYQGNPVSLAYLRDITERRLAEEALARAEEKYRSIVENAVEGIFQATPGRGQFISVNPAYAQLVGFESPEEMIASIADISSQLCANPNDCFHFQKLLDEQGIVRNFETLFRRKDGSFFWVLINGRVVRDHEGRMLHYEGTVEDITLRKKAEETIRESETRYRELADLLPETVMEYDENLMLTFINVTGNEALGYTREDIVRGLNVLDTIAGEEHEDARRALERLLGGEKTRGSEYTLVRKDGSRFPAFVHSAPIFRKGSPKGIRSVVVDITERKQVEEALRKSEEKYRDIFERAVEGIFQSTPGGTFLSVNPAFARILGYDTPADLMEGIVNIEEQMHADPRDRTSFKNVMENSGPSVIDFEHELLRKDGTTVWVSTNARSVRGPDGKILYYEGTSVDITERKHAEEERERLQSQLRQSQKMEAIGQLAGGIAHDFNNILTVLIGYGSLLRMKMDENDPLKLYVSQILSSSERAANLTQSLLAFSRKQRINPESHKINDILKSTGKLLQRLLTEDISLRMTLNKKDLQVMVDVTQMDQVLINLATNARDAMPNGGLLSIETREAALDSGFIKTHGFGKEGRYAVLSISDTGSGMDEATKDHIFEPFFTTKDVGKGTGLGLSIVYGIIKQHNGYITVYSEPGLGTTFRVYLPLIEDETKTELAPLGDMVRGTETVFLAEDDPEVRHLTREVLERYGYKTVTATDGNDAVRTFMEHKGKIDLVILDVVMPGKNGKEVYEEISRADPGIKVIFSSGYTRDVVIDKGIYNESVEFISKPLSPDKLLAKVREVLDGGKAVNSEK